MFPAGIPGIGLALLRLSVAIAAADWVGTGPWGGRHIAVAMLAAGLTGGVFTPVWAAIAFGWGAWLVVAGGFTATASGPLLAALALALIGPGAYSIDARLFGRRVLVYPPPPGH